jgi:iron complex outermembrane recepter protein
LDAKHSAAVLAALFVVVAAGHTGRACAAPVEFQIPAGPASATLPQFANQSHLNILFASDRVGAQLTRAVSGRLEPLDALKRMLVGSGLRHQFQEPDSVVVSAPDGESSINELCGRPGLEPCNIPRSEGPDLASTVTVMGMQNEAAFDSGQVSLVTPNITLTRTDFAAGGFQTVGDVLRSLPQNFGGGLNLGVIFAGGSQNTSSQSAASTVNLRGLGSDSTLVLVNGQRLAASEGSGAVDVTLIPLSAVERIDITTGSASAMYGSDAVAGVVNIIIRTDLRGIEASTAVGTATEQGNGLQHYSVAAGHAGEIADVFGVADCAWQHEIYAQQRDYIPIGISGTTLMPGMKRCSEVFSAAVPLPEDLKFKLLGVFTRRSAELVDSLTLPSGSTTASTRADVDQYAVNAVLEQRFLRSWTATLSGGLSVDDIGGRDLLRLSGAPDEYHNDLLNNRLWTGQIVVSGTVAKTRAGAVALSFGAGYNQNDFLFTGLTGSEFTVAQRRRVRFAFAESAIPLVPSAAAAKYPTALSLDLAVRREQYSELGSTTNKKVALVYKPSSGFKVQASWGTSFRAPTLLQQFDIQQAVLEWVPDAAQASGQSLALLRFGGNATLTAETSIDRELDFTIEPEAFPHNSLRVGYFSISYRQRIEYPTLNTTDPLSDPNALPFVVRNPGSAAIAQSLSQSQFLDLTGGQFTAQQATLLIDDRNQNFVRQKAAGVDLLWKYDRDTAFGRWDASLNTAYLDLQQQVMDETALAPLSGTFFYPPTWRGRLGISWSASRYLGSLFVNYTGGSREVSSSAQPVPAQKLASWTTLDGQIGMAFGGGGVWGHTKLTLSAQNLLDRHPPLIATIQPGSASVNYDSTNTSPVGCFVALQLTQVW